MHSVCHCGGHIAMNGSYSETSNNMTYINNRYGSNQKFDIYLYYIFQIYGTYVPNRKVDKQ